MRKVEVMADFLWTRRQWREERGEEVSAKVE